MLLLSSRKVLKMNNYKNRIRNIERKLNVNNGVDELELYKPDFKYSGKAFENNKQIFKHFKINDAPEYFTNEQMETLYKNGLLKYSIEQTLKAMQENL